MISKNQVGNKIFDKEVDRTNTGSLKFDFKKDKNKPDDVFPMWVADMDFQTAKQIRQALSKRAEYGVFGYTKNDDRYFEAVHSWWDKFFGVDLKKEWLITTPGVVFALATAVKTLTREGDCVLICNPVYYPFTEVVQDNGRKVVSSDLIFENGQYKIDFNDFENKIKKHKIKLFLLCSPHNPVGRVWTKSELDKIVEICKKRDVFIVSDEIHCDFVWEGKHTCIISFQDYLDNVILCASPSKTFNLAGMQISNIFIPNEEVRKRFQDELWRTGYSLVNVMGLVACQTAYEKCRTWFEDLKTYLKGNIDFVSEFLKTNLPKVKVIKPQGTYLLWLDFRGLKLSDKQIEDVMLGEAKLWLDGGTMFGESGKGFQRLNIALPRKKLKWALEKMANAFKNF